MQQGWWRIFRRHALAGQDFADPDEIAHATRVATAQLNARAQPWIWGRPEPKHRSYRRRLIYTPLRNLALADIAAAVHATGAGTGPASPPSAASYHRDNGR